MKANLKHFLQATAVAEAMSLAEQLRELDPHDQAVVAALVQQWTYKQAIANLLMAPQLLPPDIRWRTLEKGMHDYTSSYYVLAAVVGLQQYAADLTESERMAAVRQLVYLVQLAPAVIASRASVALFEISRPEDAANFIGLLDKADPVIRHNILATLLTTNREASRSLLEEAFAGNKLSASAKDYADEQIAEAFALFEEEKKSGQEQWYMSDFSAPLLLPIPSLTEYLVSATAQ